MRDAFQCNRCGDRRDFDRILRCYDLPEEPPVLAWPSWCWHCDEVSLGEYIPEPAEIIAEARAWRRRDRDWTYRIAYGPFGLDDDKRESSALAYYDTMLAWRRRRQSKGRCLYCGSVMISLAAERYGRFEHPGCGGFLECRLSICSGVGRMTMEVFSAEGIKLSEKQVIA